MTDRSTLPVLRTERLELRPVLEADLPLLIELNSDPAVMAHIRGRAATPSETKGEWLQRLGHQSDSTRGLGYWLGFEDDAFVGWWSASSFAPRPEISGMGYRLSSAAWGRGLATEGTRAMIKRAFAAPGIEGVCASTMAANTASRRVLEKVGLTHTSTWLYKGQDAITGSELGEVGYEITRAEWTAKTI